MERAAHEELLANGVADGPVRIDGRGELQDRAGAPGIALRRVVAAEDEPRVGGDARAARRLDGIRGRRRRDAGLHGLANQREGALQEGEAAPPAKAHETGLSIGELDSSGEMRLELEVDGHKGNLWLSKEMWERMGEVAGWRPAEPPKAGGWDIERLALDAEEGARSGHAAGQHRLAARLESCAEALRALLPLQQVVEELKRTVNEGIEITHDQAIKIEQLEGLLHNRKKRLAASRGDVPPETRSSGSYMGHSPAGGVLASDMTRAHLNPPETGGAPGETGAVKPPPVDPLCRCGYPLSAHEPVGQYDPCPNGSGQFEDAPSTEPPSGYWMGGLARESGKG